MSPALQADALPSEPPGKPMGGLWFPYFFYHTISFPRRIGENNSKESYSYSCPLYFRPQHCLKYCKWKVSSSVLHRNAGLQLSPMSALLNNHKFLGNTNHDVCVKLSENVNRYLLSIYYVPGILDAGNMNKIIKNEQSN